MDTTLNFAKIRSGILQAWSAIRLLANFSNPGRTWASLSPFWRGGPGMNRNAHGLRQLAVPCPTGAGVARNSTHVLGCYFMPGTLLFNFSIHAELSSIVGRKASRGATVSTCMLSSVLIIA